MKRLLQVGLGLALSVACTLSVSAKGVNVATPSKQEIVDYYYTHIQGMEQRTDTVQVEANLTAPYGAASLSDQSQQDGLALLNFIRFVAGLSYDVGLNEDYIQWMEDACLVNGVNNEITHTPEQPEDMGDDRYQSGYSGASNGNIARVWSESSDFRTNLYEDMVRGWMADQDDSNLPTLGHRRWMLYPAMESTGFAVLEIVGEDYTRYSGMYVRDQVGVPMEEYGVVWPAQTMPINLFGDRYPWSYSAGEVIGTDVTVTLTRQSDGATWVMDGSDQSDGYLSISNYPSGQEGSVIFRPDEISYDVGEVYLVELTGDVEASYSVTFFDWNQETPTQNVLGDASDWAVEELGAAQESGLLVQAELRDYPQGITRGDFCQLVMEEYLSMGGAPLEMDSPFVDTDSSAVGAAYALGIVFGVGDGYFAPDDIITHEQGILMILRMLSHF